MDRRGDALRRADLGLAVALLLFVPACQPETSRIVKPVFHLTEHVLYESGENERPRCRVGGEFRPSLGCPPLFLLTTRVAKASADHLRLSIDVPAGLRGKQAVLIPTLRLAPEVTAQALPARVVSRLRPGASLSFGFDTSQLGSESRAQVRAHALQARQREFVTEPVAIPADAVLSVGLAVSAFARESGEGDTRFRVEARWPGGSRELLRETVTAAEGGRWLDRRVELQELAGREVALHFQTESAPGNDTMASPSLSSAAFPLWGAPQVLAVGSGDSRRNVVLISLDTVRADALGARSARGDTLTPWYDRLASQGTSFSQAISTFSSTSASHMSLFTGHYPATHDVRHPIHDLPLAIATLPELMSQAGYATGAVTENAMLLAGSGFGRGFDSYRERDALKQVGAIDRTFAEGVEWLEAHSDQPFFLFLHSYEAHAPYTARQDSLDAIPPVDARGLDKDAAHWKRLRRSYSAEVHSADRALEHLFSELERLALLDDTLVVITSDHGEEFGEHGDRGHAKTVFDEVLRVPLLFWRPGEVAPGRVVDAQVSLVDVAPTILDLVGLTPPDGLAGRSQLAAMRGEASADERPRFAEASLGELRLVTARSDPHKWIWRDDDGSVQVYDLRRDPGELVPLDDPALILRGRAHIEAYLALDAQAGQAAGAPSRVLDEKTRGKLEALGYIE
jgi:arylsulfatase A-like enzyme